MDLLLHAETKKDIKRLINNPGHAIIVEGKVGSGKSSFAFKLASSILGLSSSKITNYQYFTNIKPLNTSISIDEIRRLQKFLKLKTTGSSPIRRIIIVEDAEMMTIEAQNAFLKILEEPPEDTVIIVLTSQKIKLLPTIRSRAQSVNLKQLSQNEIINHFKIKGYSDQAIIAAYHAANAQIGLMTSVLTSDISSQQLLNIKKAKELLAMNGIERLTQIDSLAKQKDEIPGLIKAFIIISQAALKTTLVKDNINQAKRWHERLKLSLATEKQLSSNPNSKLLLTNLFINL